MLEGFVIITTVEDLSYFNPREGRTIELYSKPTTVHVNKKYIVVIEKARIDNTDVKYFVKFGKDSGLTDVYAVEIKDFVGEKKIKIID